MPFCIQCGQPNGNEATFCMSCGGLLYRETKYGVVATFRRQRLIIATSIAIGLAAILIVSLRQTEPEKRSALSSRPTPPQSAASGTWDTSPVLTIVASTQDGIAISQGSGFIVTADGLAATNYHVLKGAHRALATCCGGRVFDIASIEGADLSRDLLLVQLHINGTREKPVGLPHLSLAESKPLIGDRVVAIGSPEGLEQTVSDGIVSAVRDTSGVRLLQITAPLSSGSSGGPVLNSAHQVIGIAVAQFTTGQNLNFAVAAEHLKPLLSQHLALGLDHFRVLISRWERERHREQHKQGRR